MNNAELISVIVITYNSSATLIETLDSIKQQTYPKIEIIISDDCSTDNTVEITGNWIKNNNFKVRVVTADKNGGVPANVNKGIRAASGQLVKIIAGDDILYPNAISEFYRYYTADKSVIWQARCTCFGANEDAIKKINDSIPDYVFFSWENQSQYKALSIYNRIAAPGLGLLNKQLFEKYGYYDESMPLLEDYPFNLKMSKRGICFRLIDEYLIGYRISEGSVSGIASKKYYECMKHFFFKTRIFCLFRNRYYKKLIKQLVYYTFVSFGFLIVRGENKHSFQLTRLK